MKKKLIAMLLAVTMLASLFAGSAGAAEVDMSKKITVSIFQQADVVTMEEYLNNPVLLYWQDTFNLEVE